MAYVRTVILSFLCSITLAFAQKPSPNKKAQEYYIESNKALRSNDYSQAQKHLLEAVKQDKNFATAYQQLGDIYRKTEHYEKAVSAYQEVLRIDPQLTTLTYFGIGEALLFSGQYSAAKTNLEKYKEIQTRLGRSTELTDKYIRDCDFSMANLSLQPDFKLVKVDNAINTDDDEYFPKLTADNKNIIFTRKTANQENFYESHLQDGQWSIAEKLVGKINSDDFNEGAHCISPDGTYLFFTGCNWPNGMGSCDIYVSKRENGVWSTPHNLGAPINTKGWESQPAISADGKTLYFVSNRQGSIGGYDIYKSTRKDDGTWNIPENLGPNINSKYDESSPYIHADNSTLYFASDGWPGFGRKDIFKSTLNKDGKWSIPVNMGNAINNFRDQTALHVSMNGKIGHLAAQDSSGQLDIYTFELPQAIRPGAVAYIQGTIRDADTKKTLRATISVTNTKSNMVVFEDESDQDDGTFLATLPIGHNYAVHVQQKGYLFESQQYALDKAEFADEAFTADIELKPIALGSSSKLNNIYFATNSFEILPQSDADLGALIRFLQVNTRIKIEIGGHTDNTGTIERNQQLSENRAKSVKEYLQAKGIGAERLTVRGYGQSKPVADNTTEEGKQLNRRTEFTVTAI
ncbi:OmpA family protein [Sphingobacterium psychroaquaticum]|uniref:Outer membrane protein OmpA n=1 Tax=Sphingobacterium psychroaquaticum TaxID=561061 RepID=A0A1X7HV41_9SPHI|nr:OmpA family protein [Sphingobacterium psychroaquaticum]SMG05713.1 Outer membrane protein OmpA [Sphingobacterium psychroaquaticum]